MPSNISALLGYKQANFSILKSQNSKPIFKNLKFKHWIKYISLGLQFYEPRIQKKLASGPVDGSPYPKDQDEDHDEDQDHRESDYWSDSILTWSDSRVMGFLVIRITEN